MPLKSLAFIVLTVCVLQARAQDVWLQNHFSPNSGCGLPASSVVNVLINNNSAVIMGANSINVTYTIDGGSTVSQLLSSNLTPGASWNFSFSTPANVSACGAHQVKVWVTRAGDSNHLNDTLTWTVQNDCPIVPGTVVNNVTVCESGNAGTMSLSGWSYGTILNWQSSTDMGATWTDVVNTTASNAFTNLTQNTDYRVLIDGGLCPDDTSGIATVTVQAAPVGGTIAGSDSLCEDAATGVLTLSGNTGAILGWEYSTDGSTWTPIANTTTTENYTALSASQWYRAVIEGTICPDTYSDTALIYVDPVYPPATLTGSDSLCITSASGVISANGTYGPVLSWEYSTDNGSTWSNLPNTTGTYNYNGLTQTTMYRMITEGGFCPDGISDTALIYVQALFPQPIVGVSDTFCLTSVSGSLGLSNMSSAVLDWEVSTDELVYASLGTSGMTYDYSSQTQTSWYRVLFDGEFCPDYYSDTAKIQIDIPPIAGVLNQDGSFCPNSLDTLTLTGLVADSIRWESSSDGSNWQVITGADSLSWPTSFMTQTSYYRVIASRGICPSDTSNEVTLTVFPLPIADAGLDSTIYVGDSLQLNGSGGVTGIWMPGISLSDSTVSNPIAFPVVTTDYVYYVIDLNGCINSDTVQIKVLDPIQFDIRNVITMNGDGYNDTWIISGISFFPQTDVKVFNQYGKLIYQNSDYQNEWDGSYNGSKLPNGTYYYVVHQGGTTQEFKGTLTLLGNE